MQNFQTDDFIEAVYHFSHVRVFGGQERKVTVAFQEQNDWMALK